MKVLEEWIKKDAKYIFLKSSNLTDDQKNHLSVSIKTQGFGRNQHNSVIKRWKILLTITATQTEAKARLKYF